MDAEGLVIFIVLLVVLGFAYGGVSELIDGTVNRIACIEVCKGQPVESSDRSCMCKDGLKERYVQPAK